MNRKIVLPLIPLCALMLTSCASVNQHHEIDEYFLQTDYKKDMRILQLNDIHIGDKDNRQLHFDFMDLTIKEADPDLIVLNGDLFTFASRYTARELFEFIDSYGVPWTCTYGNHDEQCYFSVDWLSGYLNDFGSHCLFKDIQDDDVFGNANFTINLMQDGHIFESLVIMDSNRYYFGDYFGYDYLKENQIEWYEKVIKRVEEKEGAVIPSLAFFHIPLLEFGEAWEASQKGSADAIWLLGKRGEHECPADKNTGMFAKVKELGSTNGIFCAHDHLNDYAINYKGVTLAYGVHSTNRIYGSDDMLGGMVITLHENHLFDIEHIFHTYEEVK